MLIVGMSAVHMWKHAETWKRNGSGCRPCVAHVASAPPQATGSPSSATRSISTASQAQCDDVTDFHTLLLSNFPL